MEDIKIKFVDFWDVFDPTDNYFHRILSKKYNVSISDEPDILFYSCYTSDHVKYKCIRIFYSAENVRPDFNACDFAITFDYNNAKRHFRLPLYLLYMERYSLKGIQLKIPTRQEAVAIWKKKTKFCCIIVSNPKATERIEFFEALNIVKRVDSGGRHLNNIGGPVVDKTEFIKDYKFVISFENSSYDGYTTEKVVEPFYAGCIPIYWGNKLVEKDINGNRFVNIHNFPDYEAAIRRIIEIDSNDELAIDMLCQPYFTGSNTEKPFVGDGIGNFLDDIIRNRKTIRPVATTYREYLHKMKILYTKILFRIRNPKFKKSR